MKIILFIILVTIGFVWWVGHDGQAPDIVDTGTLQSDIQLKEYEMSHGAARSARKAVNGNPNQQQQEASPPEQDSEIERAPKRASGGFSRGMDSIKDAVSMLVDTAIGFFK